ASAMSFWLDIRHPNDAVVEQVLDAISRRAASHADETGVRVDVSQESYSPTTHFTADLNSRLASLLPQALLPPSGSRHDAGVLARELEIEVPGDSSGAASGPASGSGGVR